MESQPEINSQPTTQLQSAESSSKSKPWLIILLVIFCLGALLAAGYFYYQNSKILSKAEGQLTPKPYPIETKPTSTSIPDPTSDWQTYSNTSLGYSLQYPNEVNVDNELNDQYNRLTDFKGDNLHFEVNLKKTPSNFNLSKYYFMDNPIKTTTTLARQKANIYELSQGYCDGPTCSDPYLAVVTENNGSIYTLIFYGDIELSEIENQILSTFQFTDNITGTSFTCPDQKVIECNKPCVDNRCPMYEPQYCSKGTAQYNWIIANCPNITITGAQ